MAEFPGVRYSFLTQTIQEGTKTLNQISSPTNPDLFTYKSSKTQVIKQNLHIYLQTFDDSTDSSLTIKQYICVNQVTKFTQAQNSSTMHRTQNRKNN